MNLQERIEQVIGKLVVENLALKDQVDAQAAALAAMQKPAAPPGEKQP